MSPFWKQFAIIFWLFYVLSASLLIFMNGFLLSRDEFTDKASCVNKSSVQYSDKLNLQVCTDSKSQKLVLLIVDALMYDFANFDVNNKQPLPYQNKMPIFMDLVKSKPRNAKLLKFIADPPTTTMQRLKGLTTGSLPTFIDAGSNFASSEIAEDNFLDQLNRSGRSVVFMGDDTWTSLYPNRFKREYPYPSFNVWDLDTVDQGVVKHMEPELKKKGWDLIIGHFLGVDHCGHRFGPEHPEMSRKLREMDDFIRNLVGMLDDETTLIVIGDHGMTANGNHGGDSAAEVTAAIFVYSPHSELFPASGEPVPQVMQVDLVPTLSSILSVPIPFSNLGTVITEVLPRVESDWPALLIDLVNNANQVNQYITKYHSYGGQFSDELVARLSREHMELVVKATKLKNLAGFHEFVADVRRYLGSVKLMCEEVWVQFDLASMVLGCFATLAASFAVFIVISAIPVQEFIDFASTKKLSLALFVSVATSVISWLFLGAFLEFSCFMSLFLIVVFIFINRHEANNHLKAIKQSKSLIDLNILSAIVLLISLFGLGSDNFVVEEGFAVSILTAALIASLFFFWVERKQKPAHLFYGLLSYQKLAFTAFIAAFFALVWSLALYWQCREEQSWCQSLPSTDLNKNGKLYQQVAFTPLIFHTFPVLANWYWLKKNGNLVSNELTSQFITYLPILTTVLSIMYWVLESLPAHLLKKTVQWDLQILPQICFLLILISFLCLLYDPLLVHVVHPREQVPEGRADLVPYLFHQVKSALNRNGKKGVCAVYGLSTAFSSAASVVGLLLYQLLSLLQGSKVVPALVITLIALMLLIIIASVSRLNTIVLPGQLVYVPWFAVVSWALLSVVCFYGTGHNATFPGIQWQAAFVGTSGQFSSNFLPGLLIIASTFSSQILFGVLLPLLLVAPLTVLSINGGLARQDVKEKAANGEMFIYEKSSLTEQGLFMLCVKYILVLFLRVYLKNSLETVVV
ncbi:Hypothetical predicted protein [Cloeon dipterum]|uniref:GPI ethanolamine phosphate transferase 3, catalytic subunit n=2 Tax=Cloeon dipterum TaxID=197152 RepID=A0A8S1CCW7_9INSE|nr:Hypothetical predicted protein [Cloeon dipterum]